VARAILGDCERTGATGRTVHGGRRARECHEGLRSLVLMHLLRDSIWNTFWEGFWDTFWDTFWEGFIHKEQRYFAAAATGQYLQAVWSSAGHLKDVLIPISTLLTSQPTALQNHGGLPAWCVKKLLTLNKSTASTQKLVANIP